MKKVLGLDLGTASIGWALVNEAESEEEQSNIVKLGVRIIQYDNFNKVDKSGKISESKNPIEDFIGGKGLSPNAKRTQQRGARRNLQRFKQRRKNLIKILIDSGLITKETPLTEIGDNTTFQTLSLRAKSANEKITKEEFARVLLAINKKRGYKSSRKAKNEEEGSLIDGMAVAKELYDKNITPGQFVYKLLSEEKIYIPDFYRSDLQDEFNKVWDFQKQFYPEVLTDEFYEILKGQGLQNSRKRFLAVHQVYTAENKGKRDAVRKQHFKWRSEAINKQLLIDEVAYVLVEINNSLNKSSGYLGAISDRSKELYFEKETVGENLYNQLQVNSHTRLKSQVFYRQDYLDEFEQIWETQATYNPSLTKELKEEIRDVIIFYQRKLKSQKHLITECEFEKHHKAIPKSSPLFQEFKIWQNLNDVEIKNKISKEKVSFKELDDDIRQNVFEELNLRGGLKSDTFLQLLKLDKKEWALNFKDIEGNRTNQALYNVYQQILEYEGYGFDWSKKTAKEIKEELSVVLPEIGIRSEILNFDAEIKGNEFDKQISYQLWHLLYTAEDDKQLIEKLKDKYGFKSDYSRIMAGVTLQQDYGRLSARAIKKIIPFLSCGNNYYEACSLAKYNHSHSLTKEEQENRILKDNLELLKKNSLRNPVVEKILNQMVNVINQVIETYGKPDEIRIELARELKKSSDERKRMTEGINKATTRNDGIRKLLIKDFGIKNPTRNDVIRFKLYEELKDNGYKTLFTDTYISKDKLFSKEIDIEHIIPKAKLFDDSFSNKTLAYRSVNLDKADTTAFDFISVKHANDLENYKLRVETLYKNKEISKGKYSKLLMPEKDLPDGFIERDLRNSQYIAKKAKQMLQETVRTVNTTTGTITSKLRDDWDLINVMQELNLPKYKAIDESLIEQIEKKEGTFKIRIKDWSKRNDHRHHAMDALTVAFTTYNHVQYLNNLNSSRDKENSKLYGIRNKVTKVYEYSKGRKKRKFVPPMPSFREKAKRYIESILISFKAKNKVVTRNINKTKLKGKDNFKTKVQLTPRGQLHNETIYGKIKEVLVKNEKVSGKFDKMKILQVTKPIYKEALLQRLEEFDNNPKKAFTGKNALSKNPIYLNDSKKKIVPDIVKTQFFEDNYTIRKDITPELKVEKVIDLGLKSILEKRVKEFDGDKKKAFADLEKYPIWLNKEKGISIKRVTITGVKNTEALHTKKDHLGKEILKGGIEQAVDFVSTGNNHHVAIYKDEKGKLQEKVVSFYEAVAKVNAGLSIIDKDHNKVKGWQFLFTMKQNEMFVFPSNDFNPSEIDLEDEKNASLISEHLYRVQKISTKNYMFTHHLETKAITGDILKEKKQLSGHIYNFIQSTEPLKNIIKVRINHLGEIVQVGEY